MRIPLVVLTLLAIGHAALAGPAGTDPHATLDALREAVEHAVPGAVAVGVGTFGAAAVHDEPYERTARSYVAGVGGAVLPAIVLEGCLPAEWVASPGAGMPTVAKMVQQLGLVVGAGAAATTSGLATWAAGEQDAASRSSDGALAGALIGSSLGAITSIAVTNALANRYSSHFTHRVAIASSLIASGASLGYQIGGGGRR
jgi:hypothetical protein